jgi:hypothetical protein
MYSLERLEPRLLLAAKVTQAGDSLNITGDGGDDHILIFGTGKAGEVAVMVDSDGDGMVDESLGVYTGVKNVNANLKGGDDVLGIVEAGLAGNVNVNAGGGRDSALIVDSLIGGDVTLNMGGGIDVVLIGGQNFESGIGGDVTINTGGESDLVMLREADLYGDLTVNTGGGLDVVAIYEGSADISGQVNVNGGGGQDYLTGESINDLKQELSQSNAAVSGFEKQVDLDDIPPSVVSIFVTV